MNPITQTAIWKVFGDALDRMAQGIAYIDNGCTPSAGSGLTVSVAAGDFLVNSGSTLTNYAGGSVTPGAADASLPRRDLIHFSSAGTLTCTAGTAASAPVPASLPSGSALVAVVFIPAGATDYSAGFPTAGIADYRMLRQRGAIDGTEAAPGMVFDDDQNTGFRRPAADRLIAVTAGADRWEIAAAGHLIASDDATYDIGADGATRPRNVFLSGVVNAGDGAEGAPSLSFDSDPDTGVYKGGTNILNLVTAGADRWQVTAAGHLLAVDDDTYDIGASGATRPRNIYASGTLTVPNIAATTLAAPTIADFTNAAHDHGDTDDGGALAASITLTTPTIADFTNAQHDHGDANDGGVLVAAAIAGLPVGDLYNFLTNPNMSINQRGGTVTATGSYSFDRQLLTLAGTDTITITEETSIVDTGAAKSLKGVFVLGNGAGASNIGESLTNADLGAYSLRGQTVTFRIRCRTATATAIRAGVNTDGTGGTTTYSGYHSGGGAFESLDVTVAVPSDATVCNVRLYLAASCTFYYGPRTLVIGSTPQAPYPLTPAEEWERCQRYYFITLSAANSGPTVIESANGAQAFGQWMPWPVRMATLPTVALSGTWGVVNCGQPVVDNESLDGALLYATASAAGVAQFNPNGTDDVISGEANP